MPPKSEKQTEQKAESQPAVVDNVSQDFPPERDGRHVMAGAVALLRRVCGIFGVNPDPTLRPQELLVWKFYPADGVNQVPAAVHIVTGNAQKLRYYEDDTLDEETVQALARIFKLAPKPNGGPWTSDDLPESLTLPRVHVTGIPASMEHQYPGGYLRSGGAAESSRRQARKASKK